MRARRGGLNRTLGVELRLLALPVRRRRPPWNRRRGGNRIIRKNLPRMAVQVIRDFSKERGPKIAQLPLPYTANAGQLAIVDRVIARHRPQGGIVQNAVGRQAASLRQLPAHPSQPLKQLLIVGSAIVGGAASPLCWFLGWPLEGCRRKYVPWLRLQVAGDHRQRY